MTITIESWWWVLPLAITIVSFAFAWKEQPLIHNGGYLPDVGSALFGLIFYLVAAVFSLVSWLIWALLT